MFLGCPESCPVQKRGGTNGSVPLKWRQVAACLNGEVQHNGPCSYSIPKNGTSLPTKNKDRLHAVYNGLKAAG